MITLHVLGNNLASHAIASVLHRGGYTLAKLGAAYTIEAGIGELPYVVVDGVDSSLECRIANEIGRLAPEGGVFLQVLGGVQDPARVRILTPPQPSPAHLFAISHGVLRAMDTLLVAERLRLNPPPAPPAPPTIGQRLRRAWSHFLTHVVLLSVLSGAAAAQTQTIVEVRDSTTGAVVANVGDTTNKALRVYCVGSSCSGGAGGSSFTDNSVFTAGTTGVNIFAGIFDDGLADVTSGNAAGGRITAKRALHVNFRNASGTEIGTSANPIRIDPTGTTTQPTSVQNFPTTATTSAVSIRCVNTAGNAFEACGGGGGSGGDGALLDGVSSAIKGTVRDYTNANPLAVQLTDSNGDAIATQPVSGTVTANAGTNLNTSALALDATLTGRLPAGGSPADNESNTNTNLSRIGGFNYVFDGTAWDRWTGAVSLSAALPAGTNNIGDVDVLTLPANASVNLSQVAGTTTSVNTGAADAGTQRVAIATQTLSVNQTQVNGVAVSTSNGVSDTGTQRTVLAQEATYSAGTTAKTATAAGTGVFFNICGSASKTIRVQRISVSGTVATTAVYGDIVIKKTSTATTGGTATTLTNAPYDSNSAAATAIAKYYTVLGTAGTSVGVIFTATQFFPVTATAALTPPPLVYLWRDQDAEAPTLRGTTQCLEMNFGTTTTNAPTLSVSVAWTEK